MSLWISWSRSRVFSDWRLQKRENALICKVGDKSRGNILAGAAPSTRKTVQGMNTLYGCAYIKIIYVNIITMLWQWRGRGRGDRTGRQTAVVWLEQGCQKLPTGTLIPATYLWMYQYLCKCIRSCSTVWVCVFMCVLQVSVKCKTLVCARVSVRYKDIASVAAGRGLLLLLLVAKWVHISDKLLHTVRVRRRLAQNVFNKLNLHTHTRAYSSS